jgi:long-chain acyl-CoA synthetase
MSDQLTASARQPVTGEDGSGRPPLEPRLLTDLLDHAVKTWPQRAAIDFMGRIFSYAEIGAEVQKAAAGLQALGVKPGDRIGLCLPNTPYYVTLYFAALRVGAIIVNLNPLYVEREMCHLIKDSGAKFVATIDVADIHAKVSRVQEMLGFETFEKLITCPLAGALPTAKSLLYRVFKRGDIAHPPHDGAHIDYAELLQHGDAPTPVALTPDDVAVLQYTGGTTGEPKAAMLTHANLTTNAEAEIVHVGGEGSEQERIVGVLPLFHVFALTSVLNFGIRIGAELILLPRFELDQVLKTIARTRPSFFPAVPTIYGAINAVAEQKGLDFSYMRACVSGGAPLPAEVRTRFEQLTGAKVVEGYGLSEASPIIACNPLNGVNKAGSAGIAFPGTTIEIRDMDDLHKILPAGERGEICARGPQVMKGYWNRPDATANVFVDGALRTGDIGYLDEDGYLFLVDRQKDLILAGGYNVYPRTIEEALYEHPAVHEAICIGVDDEYRGQAPKAFVTLKEGQQASPQELRDFLKDKLSKIEMPKEVEIRDQLPKTLIGKLSKKELVEEERAKAKG